MKTSWNKSQAIERYLLGTLPLADALLFRARLLTDPELRQNVALQKETYALVQHYGREKMKTRLEALHRRLFQDPAKKSFQQEVLHYFNKP
jgi:anti-sigma factor RsiW